MPTKKRAGQNIRKKKELSSGRYLSDGLAESRKKTEFIFNSTKEGILVVDILSKKFVEFNKVMSEILGYKGSDLKKMSVKDIHPKKDLPYVMSQLNMQITGKRSLAKNIPVKRKDGSVFVADVTASPIVISGRDCLIGTFRDMTEEIAMQSAYLEARNMSDNIVQSIPAGLFVYEYIKPDKLFLLSANPAGLKMTGKKKNIIGKEFNEIWTSAKDTGTTKKFLNVMLTGKALTAEDIYYKDGDIDGMFQVTVFCVAENKLGVAFENITKKKQYELDLKESEENYRSIFNSVNDGICITDMEGRILEANRNMSKIYGYAYAELIGMSAERLTMPNSRYGFDVYLKAIRSGKKFLIETVDQRKDGEPVSVEIKGSAVDYKGQKCSLVVVRDISERKNLEKVKNSIIRDLSHGLKTPIALIQMALDIIKKKTCAGQAGQFHDAYLIGKKNIVIMKREIDNILKASSLDIKKMGKLKKRKASMYRALSKSVDAIRPLVEGKALKLSTECTVSKNAKIAVASKDLEVLIANILDNAVKFTDRGGITVSCSSKGKWIEIEIGDTGCGIPRSDKEVIFEKFHQSNPAIEGSGLGLYISKELAVLYGGTISVLSKGKGKGTLVKVVLPKA